MPALSERDGSPSAPVLRAAAIAAFVGTIGYAAVTVLHGDPPINDTSRLLAMVAEQPAWRLAHLGNILAVLLWMWALRVLGASLPGGDPLGRIAHATMVCAAAVFAVYFSLHGFGLSTLARRWSDASAGQRGSLVIQADSVLTVLGSVAFTAQALIGLSILLYGTTMTWSGSGPRWLGWLGVATGAGWFAGAIVLEFAVIVPFTMLGWLWMLGIGVFLWRSRPAATELAPDPGRAP